jgi:hypothetical protein
MENENRNTNLLLPCVALLLFRKKLPPRKKFWFSTKRALFAAEVWTRLNDGAKKEIEANRMNQL